MELELAKGTGIPPGREEKGPKGDGTGTRPRGDRNHLKIEDLVPALPFASST